MKVDTYKVLEDCVEEGVRYGYHRAYKYSDNPTEEDMVSNIEREVMNQICEYFSFDTEILEVLSDIRDNTRKFPRIGAL